MTDDQHGETVKGRKVNNSPKMVDGSSAMFTRVLTKEQVDESVKKVMELNPHAPCSFDADNDFLRIYAPDGDLVFASFPKSETMYICRFHKEVFSQEEDVLSRLT